MHAFVSMKHMLAEAKSDDVQNHLQNLDCLTVIMLPNLQEEIDQLLKLPGKL